MSSQSSWRKLLTQRDGELFIAWSFDIRLVDWASCAELVVERIRWVFRSYYIVCLDIAECCKMLLEYLAIIVVLLVLAYRWSTSSYSFFEKQGIEHDKPYPFVGSMWELVMRRKSMFDVIIELYNKGDSKWVGGIVYYVAYCVEGQDVISSVIYHIWRSLMYVYCCVSFQSLELGGD